VQDLKYELGRERKANQALLTQINELTGQLKVDRKEKSGKLLHVYFAVVFMPEPTLSRLYLNRTLTTTEYSQDNSDVRKKEVTKISAF
jgi:acyl transferase domain-containing protein